MLFDFHESSKAFSPYIAFMGGWWDLVILGVINEVKQTTYMAGQSGEMNPDLFLHDALTLFVVYFVFRSMYALCRYFPYGRRGRTFWYPVAEAVGIFLVFNVLRTLSSAIDSSFITDIIQAIVLIGLLRLIMSSFILMQNLLNMTFKSLPINTRRS